MMRNVKKKVCLLGEFSVGKTSLIRRYVEGRFDEKYLSTIGVSISRKSLHRDGYELDLIIWDLAGGEEFAGVNASYLRGSVGAILVCDLSRPETLDVVRSSAQLARAVNPQIDLVLAANKCDLVSDRTAINPFLETLAGELGSPWLYTSAKSGEQVGDLFDCLASEIERQNE